MGSRGSAEAARARVDEDRDGDEVPGQESEEDGPGENTRHTHTDHVYSRRAHPVACSPPFLPLLVTDQQKGAK